MHSLQSLVFRFLPCSSSRPTSTQVASFQVVTVASISPTTTNNDCSMANINRVGTRWTIRLMPIFILSMYGVGTYAVIDHLCLHHIRRDLGNHGLAAALMTLFFVFLVLSLSSYLRTFVAIQRDPGLVPLIANGAPQEAHEEKWSNKSSWSCRPQPHDIEASPRAPRDIDTQNPGLETFYNKLVFVCETDGRPRWCSVCHQWKPDRAHHASELGRCVRKMDHLCPWVGGMVSETSFNFFFLFTVYTTCLCSISIAAAAYSLHHQVKDADAHLDAWTIVVLAMASLFGLFTLVMALTASRFVFTNITNIDVLRSKQPFSLAIRVPRDTVPSASFATITYPLVQGSSFQPRVPPSSLYSMVRYPPPDRHLQAVDEAHSQPSAPQRDQQAIRKFAIVSGNPRENPWNLGFWGNFKSVMGNNVFEWLLPIRQSPCCSHDSAESEYQFGKLVAILKKRNNVPDFDGDGTEATDV